MIAFTRIYLDTNIFIFAFEEISERSDLLSEMFDLSIRHQMPLLVTSELTLSEILVRPYSKSEDSVVDKYDSFLKTSHWLDVSEISRTILKRAAVLRSLSRSLKLPDAIHLASAMAAECYHVLTADTGLTSISQDWLLQAGAGDNARPLTIIRPDEPTLTSLLQSLSP